MSTYRKKLIEVAMPLTDLSDAAAKEKTVRQGHPSSLHLWWARRPLAAARGVLFGQLIDDPSEWPEFFPTADAQRKERARLFELLARLVRWEHTGNRRLMEAARGEIARSAARDLLAREPDNGSLRELVEGRAGPEAVAAFIAEHIPIVHDPFAGGGAIPLEAHRLGLRSLGTDLNPVPFLINRALIDVPARFPIGRLRALAGKWRSPLASDVERFGKQVLARAREHLRTAYPSEDGEKPIAWIWARTVPSPDPAFGDVQVPLMTSFWLRKKSGSGVWLEPVVDPSARSWRFRVASGAAPSDPKAVSRGTKAGRGATFRCVLSGTVISRDHVRAAAEAGTLGASLVVVALDGGRSVGRLYREPTAGDEAASRSVEPTWTPDYEFVENTRYMTPCAYGMKTFASLFTQRQLAAMGVFADLVDGIHAEVEVAGTERGLATDGVSFEDGGSGARAYADAVCLYLAFALDKLADLNNSLCGWEPIAQCPRHLFGRQAIPIVWDFAEANPLGESSGSWFVILRGICKALDSHHLSLGAGSGRAESRLGDAASPETYAPPAVISTDPPYYDNVPYADLSDFFYVWLRRSLRRRFPGAFRTLLVPKATELVAEPFRHGSPAEAEAFFLRGMTTAMSCMSQAGAASYPVTIYYAFKQSETGTGGTSSTGWETFLQAVINAGFEVTGTWPIRTENASRLRGQGSNALATSVVLVCRPRHPEARVITRGDLRRELLDELPDAIARLREGNIAPVDLAQAAIGPGMAVYSRYPRVLEGDGRDMAMRSVLQLINEVADEVLGAEEADWDSETRFAVTWFTGSGYETGPYGDAETLAKARNVSVAGVDGAGLLKSAAGKVRLLRRDELDSDWSPTADPTLTVWECAQHLIRTLDAEGESAAASLLAAIGAMADHARSLAYRLYTICERKGWAEEGRAYNSLVVAWPELERLRPDASTPAPGSQAELF